MNEQNTRKNGKAVGSERLPWWLWVIPIGVTLLWLVWPHWLAVPVTLQAVTSTIATPSAPLGVASAASRSLPVNVTMTDLGQAGDLFGGLNALFAGLAFSFVAIAAWFQRKTLLTQHIQIEAAHEQQRLAEFEPLFFQLINLFRDLHSKAKNIDYPNPGPGDLSLDGSGVTNHVRYIANMALRGDHLTLEEALREIDIQYSNFYQLNEQILGPLFRTLYHVFRLVSESGLVEPIQVRYANIARGLLGGNFLLLLMLNCLSHQGRGFKPYVELFGLLKHVRGAGSGNDLDNSIAMKYFSKSATMNYLERQEFWKNNIPPTLTQ